MRKNQHAYNQQYYKRNRKKILAGNARWRKTNLHTAANRGLCSRFGKNAVEHFNKQLRLQKFRCAICRRSFKITKANQDHDNGCCSRKDGKLHSCGLCSRGILCNGCNVHLTMVEDKKMLKNAVAYLRKWGCHVAI